MIPGAVLGAVDGVGGSCDMKIEFRCERKTVFNANFLSASLATVTNAGGGRPA